MVEMMLALGLADRMAGVSGVGPDRLVRAELRADFDRVPKLAGDYLELEPLIDANPDFLFAGWNYGLSEANAMIPRTLGERGISVYELTESCAHVIANKKAPGFEEVFGDLTNLGRIFGVDDRARELIDGQRAVLNDVERRVRGRTPVRVFVYDSGEEAPVTAPGLAMPNELIRFAGGVNIFADLHKTWSAVSWEQVIARDPQCVVIVDYDKTTWQQKRDFTRNHPSLKTLTAVRNDCFLALPYAAVTPGVRNAEAVRQIAGRLHPQVFTGN
jgi:iron complex transport system substrate-binding protein